ncbi:MAG: hypothetical protein ACI87O_001778, partial [Planctomycetota bacterium]
MTPRLLQNSLTKTLGVGLCFLIISCGGNEKEPGGGGETGAETGAETGGETGAGEATTGAEKPSSTASATKDPLEGVDLSAYDTNLEMVT